MINNPAFSQFYRGLEHGSLIQPDSDLFL